MTGAEHYAEAERLLENAQYPQRVITGVTDPGPEGLENIHEAFGDQRTVVFSDPVEIHDTVVATAQVHATLALVAATRGQFS